VKTGVDASVKTTILIDPQRMDALNQITKTTHQITKTTQRSRNSLLREAVDDLITKYNVGEKP
jgi:hypothetical protein